MLSFSVLISPMLSPEKIRLYSPTCGVIIVLVPEISFKTLGMRAEASNNNFVPSFFNCLISESNASDFAILIPIPIAALSAFFGIVLINLLTDPAVSLSSGIGKAIIFGEKHLTATRIDLGIAVYTRSVPDLRAAIEASIGAPWYNLLPPTTRTVPLSPFLEDSKRGTM